MGQKVNPVGLRIGINKDWNTRWFASNQEFSTFLLEDIEIRKFLESKIADALLSHIEINRVRKDKSNDIIVKCFVARPGVLIGKEAERINKLTKELAKVVKTGKARIDCVEVKNVNLDARLVALSIAKQLEERVSFRIAQKKAIKAVREAGALGVKTSVSGRLGGADIARAEGYKDGILSLHTFKSDVDYATAEAETTYGRLGVKVWICRGFIEKAPKKLVKEGE